MPCFDKQKKWVLNHLPGQSDKKEVSSGEMEKALEAERPASYNDTGEEEGDENTERGNWTRQLDFVLSCVGYAVGLGNLWRFPYICMLNGGGAFLIPYFTFLIICGIPLFFMELTLGQFSSLSPISVWKMCPLFKGLGWGMVLVSGIVCVYYNVIITWCLYYLIMSFTSKLPWGSCDNSWNTDLCATSTGNKTEFTNMTISNVTDQSSVYSMVTAVTEMTGNFTNVTMGNVTEVKKMTSAEEYWQYNTLEMTKSMNELGGIRWQLLLCLVLSWVLVFVCLCKGVKSSGKVVYVTATAPYIFLVILLIRGLLLPGAMDGIKFYVTPDFKRLLDYKVWVEACLQIFYSLGPAWGGLITMSSYNKFHNNVYRDAIFVPCVNCGSSFFAGFVIFSVLGFMAKESGLNVKDVVKPGPGLAFSAYPQAITKLPISPLWAVMFFFMLLTLGLDTQFGMFETLTSAFVDEFPGLLKGKKLRFTIFICVIQFLAGLIFITRAGIYFFVLFDWYSAAFSVMVISLLECVAVAWVYGVDRLYYDIELMIGYKPSIIWKVCWRFITPIIMLVILGFTIGTMNEPKYGDYTLPRWAIALGWCVAMVSIIPIPGIAIYKIIKEKGTLRQRLWKLTRPEDDWGPALQKYRKTYKYSKNYNSANNGELHNLYPVTTTINTGITPPTNDKVDNV